MDTARATDIAHYLLSGPPVMFAKAAPSPAQRCSMLHRTWCSAAHTGLGGKSEPTWPDVKAVPRGSNFLSYQGPLGQGPLQYGDGERTRGNGRGQAGLRCRRLRLSPQTGRNPPPVAHAQMSGRSCSRRGWPELTAQGRGPRGRWGGRRLLHRVPRSYR